MLMLALPKLALAATLASVQVPVPYNNPTYGFALDLPARQVLCADDPPAPNRGFFFLLDTPEVCPFAMSGETPYISVAASYNALEDKTLKEVMDRYCDPKSVRATASSDLRFAALPSASCRYKDRRGFIHVTVFAFHKARRDPALGRNPADWIALEAFLTTTPKRLKQDLATFRTVLGAMKFSPAP